MTVDQNTLRRLNKLWKDRHGHSTDTTADELVEIRETISSGSGGAVVSPAYIHLTHNSGQTIAVAGEAISWDTQHPLIDPVGFADPADTATDDLPLTTVVVPYDGYYGVKVELKWDSHTAGGTVEIRRTRNNNAVRLWPTDDDPGVWTATDGAVFADIAVVPAIAGDLLSVYVDHDAGATKDLSTAQVIFYKVESSAVVRSLYKAAVLASGPVAYWRLDETSGTSAADTSGNSNGGTYVGTPTLEVDGVMKDGSGSTSVHFDGSTQYVVVDAVIADMVGETALTVEAWIRHDSFAGQDAIFGINLLSAGAGDDNIYVLWVQADGTLLWDDDGVSETSTAALSALTAHYVVATRDGSGNLMFYIDGVWDSTHATTPSTPSGSGEAATIGMEYDPASAKSDYFDGRIDEVAIYTRALDPDEILEHYNIGRGVFL